MSVLKSGYEYDTMKVLTMIGFLKFIGIFLLVVLFVGTGQLLSSSVGRSNLWQMFWLGFIIWLWGYIILIRAKDKARLEEVKYAKNPLLLQQRQELEKVKVAAVSALVAITFFYFSISWFFHDDLILSTIVLIVTFFVSILLQNTILERQRKQEE